MCCILTVVDIRCGCLVATDQSSHANNSRQCSNAYFAQNTLYVYRMDQAQCLTSCHMLGEILPMQQGIAVMLCHLGWCTLL
jgi:hypothetical protein